MRHRAGHIETLRLEHAAEADEDEELAEEQGEVAEEEGFEGAAPEKAEPEVSRITSHILRCRVDGYKG